MDVNGDGLNDILGDEYGEIRIWYQNTDHTFRNYVVHDYNLGGSGGSAQFRALTLGDVTGDGLADAVVTLSSRGVYVFPNIGTYFP